MIVRITHTMSVKYSYSKARECPLFHTLKKLGLKLWMVGVGIVYMENGKVYHFPFRNNMTVYDQLPVHHCKPTTWNSLTHKWCKSRRRSVDLDIPGLEQEFEQQQ